MVVQSSSLNNKVLILLAPGFEEITTVYLLTHMREAGLSVSLISLTAGLVTGHHGLAVRPDYSLEQLNTKPPSQLLIVPGGRECTSALVTDPRVHQLIDTTLNNNGYVAATLTAEAFLTQMGISTLRDNPNFIQQENMEIESFTKLLVNLLAGQQQFG